jgi:prophage antirepressor-like protein
LADLVPGTRGAEKPRVFLWEAGAAAVRVVGNASAPLFVGKDVCDALGYTKYRDALALLEADERVSSQVDTLGGPQEMTCVTESGFYALAFGSRKEQARVFRKWVTSEVLPQIRKTGAYNGVPTLARHTIEIRHLPAEPTVVVTTEEQLVAQLVFTLLNRRERVIVRAGTLVDFAMRDKEFEGWFVHRHEGYDSTARFMRRLVAYFNRPLIGCYSPSARALITPSGEGRARRYVLSSHQVTEHASYVSETLAENAVAIVGRALGVGGEVTVK